ncbi:type 1 glutamine amidotransferase [Salipiger sp. 1_MG-2023]|uniref:type 1 glutamine amidotransferase n=1 Tax=Salipiger sp. 1_MG-2023 TaxID=3062665 RepID=UPI0026E3B949|nr:type 1 glutamine amidotransferase [Salipiger sp. 1_MG-2023]MDO6583937.1 type 1 glutamine amidotransferase [Salipiger sp. 1_MG-2023]
MKIGILQPGLVPDVILEEVGDYDAQFRALLAGHGFDFETWKVVNGNFPAGPDDADGWLITGSRHGAYENHPWMAPLEELIRAIYASGKPLIGVCFGHQIIAQALGGKVEKSEQGWVVGPTLYRYGDRLRLVNAWHQDQVVTLPEGAEVVASSEICPYAAIHYPGHAYTVQPHPEFRRDFAQALIVHRAPGVVPPALVDEATAKLDMPLDSAEIGAQFATFFKEKRLA